MHDFVLATIGGALIGLAATFLMAVHGKVMGVSGIVSRILPPVEGDWGWRISFVLGVIAAPIAFVALSGTPIPFTVTDNIRLLITAGLIVGAGTVIGSGCTSGHGVCGLPRLSARSFVATGVFMAVAMATVFFMRHVLGG